MSFNRAVLAQPLDFRVLSEALNNSRAGRGLARILFFAGTLCLASSVVAVYRAAASLEEAGQASAIHSYSLARPVILQKANAVGDAFVADLPPAAPIDSQFRFAAKIAHEQDVSIVQMQSEPLKSDPATLGETRLTLQARGDYRAIKNLWIALLEKYPGLTSERFTVRHHAESSPSIPPQSAPLVQSAADRGDDEAAIELIQYTRLAVLTR